MTPPSSASRVESNWELERETEESTQFESLKMPLPELDLAVVVEMSESSKERTSPEAPRRFLSILRSRPSLPYISEAVMVFTLIVEAVGVIMKILRREDKDAT